MRRLTTADRLLEEHRKAELLLKHETLIRWALCDALKQPRDPVQRRMYQELLDELGAAR